MIRGDRRGCVKLRNAQVGIDDEDDSTFTITVDHKTFHFQARDADERQRWLDALQEARDLHTHNYALLHQTNRLLEQPSSLSSFDRQIIEADGYLQILIEHQQELLSEGLTAEGSYTDSLKVIQDRLKTLIELIKKSIVCLQVARESMFSTFSTITVNRDYPVRQSIHDKSTDHLNRTKGAKLDRDSGKIVNDVSVRYRADSSDQISIFSSTDLQSKIDYTRASSLNDRNGAGDAVTSYHSPSADSTSPNHKDNLAQSFASIADGSPLLDTKGNESPLSRPPQLPSSSVDTHTLKSLSTLLRSYSSDDELTKSSGEDEFFDTQDWPDDQSESSMSSAARLRLSQISANNQQGFSRDETFDELYDEVEEEDLGSVQSRGSVITHLLSQLRIGMDLTRITLPTFILERRSTLEMYADFLAHPDLWVAITDGATPKDRIVACLRWYLSAFHAGRRSSVAKKPYNPILGEIFRCYWPVDGIKESTTPTTLDLNVLRKRGPIPWAPPNSVVFLAEQVSHHPPISAFYAENVEKRISLDGHVWTKSKFLGLSIAVEMVGAAVISLLDLDEEYVVTFPCGYGRNILATPWIELGGKTSIICAKTGYVATVDFRTKPFYGGKKDIIQADVFSPNDKKPFLVVSGEWNNKMWIKNLQNNTSSQPNDIFVDTRAMPIFRKCVKSRTLQEENESRRLWEQITSNLKFGNIDAATDAKFRLEQRQRDHARQLAETKTVWAPEYFRGEGGNWIYRSPLIQRIPEVSNSCDSKITPDDAELNDPSQCTNHYSVTQTDLNSSDRLDGFQSSDFNDASVCAINDS